MKKIITVEIEIPEGVKVSLDGTIVLVSGKNGEVKRELFDPNLEIRTEESKIIISANKRTKREKRKIGTFKAHIKNMIAGATKDHLYKLKICSAHFPMTVTADKGQFSIKNFLGEKVPRTIKLRQGVDVKIDGDVIEVSSSDKELASQTAANIEQLTRVTNFDLRIFQDGCYIIEKDGKVIK